MPNKIIEYNGIISSIEQRNTGKMINQSKNIMGRCPEKLKERTSLLRL